MTMNVRKERPGTGRGEAIIRNAFRWSVAVILGLLLVGVALYLWLRPSAEPEVVEEVAVQLPETVSRSKDPVPPPVRFADITREAGIDFIHVNGAYGERLMPETIGSGAAFIDYDNDGDQDLFLVNSNYWSGHEKPGTPPRQRLYRNDGTGRFKDVTERAGLGVTSYGMGVAVGDYDNDGWTDLYLTTVGRNHLFRNQGGRFHEVTEKAGVAGSSRAWSSSAAFIDYDNDGDLDLFVGNYVQWSRDIDLEIDFRLTGLGRAYGAPDHFIGTNSTLYRNDGNGRFNDVSKMAGIVVEDPGSGLPVGKALGVVPTDYDRDGWIDLFVANDTTRNFLFHNLGNGVFEEVGVFEGVAFDRDGKATSGMGIDAAWFRNDQDLGVMVGNFANEMSALYLMADGQTPFADEAILEGLGPPSRLALTFGVLFLDYDLDGRPDLLQANGHLEREINTVQPSQHYAQPPQLLWNCGEACRVRFIEVREMGDLSKPLVGRSVASADIDGDGDLDLLITQNGRRPALFRNEQQLEHHWLRLRLEGTASNRSAIGARVEVTANGVTQRRELVPSRGFMGQVELPVTFGLGTSEQVESLVIHWPGGRRQELTLEQVDTTLTVRQPEPGKPQ
jgi:hypothetical protein